MLLFPNLTGLCLMFVLFSLLILVFCPDQQFHPLPSHLQVSPFLSLLFSSSFPPLFGKSSTEISNQVLHKSYGLRLQNTQCRRPAIRVGLDVHFPLQKWIKNRSCWNSIRTRLVLWRAVDWLASKRTTSSHSRAEEREKQQYQDVLSFSQTMILAVTARQD